jgi:hypothetical protein
VHVVEPGSLLNDPDQHGMHDELEWGAYCPARHLLAVVKTTHSSSAKVLVI